MKPASEWTLKAGIEHPDIPGRGASRLVVRVNRGIAGGKVDTCELTPLQAIDLACELTRYVGIAMRNGAKP